MIKFSSLNPNRENISAQKLFLVITVYEVWAFLWVIPTPLIHQFVGTTFIVTDLWQLLERHLFAERRGNIHDVYAVAAVEGEQYWWFATYLLRKVAQFRAKLLEGPSGLGRSDSRLKYFSTAIICSRSCTCTRGNPECTRVTQSKHSEDDIFEVEDKSSKT